MRARTAALLLVVFLVPAPAAAQSDEVQTRDLTVASFDGTVLAATLYWTEAAEAAPAPVILTTHGWANDRSQRDPDARWLAGLGYVVLAYDSRGYGASGGVVGLNGPDEVADVSALIDWLAALNGTGDPRIRLDGDGDPRLGMTGLSYSGAIQLLAAANDPRIDAIQPDITWNNLSEALAPGGVVKRGWLDLLFWGGLLTSHGAGTTQPDTQGMDARLRDWYLEAQTTGRLPDEAGPVLLERSPATVLDEVHVPVFLTQGWPDTLFDPSQALATYAALAGRPDTETRLLVHPGGHGYDTAPRVRERVREEVAAFLDRHLNDREGPPSSPVVVHRAWTGGWPSAAAWPVPGVRIETVGAAADGVVLLAQAPAPSSVTEAQELEGALGLPHAQAPVTSTLVPLDVAGPRGLLGTPRVFLGVTPTMEDLTLFFSLVDRGPAGDRVVHKQVTAVRVEGQADRLVPLDVPLVATEHHLQAGHALLLRVSTSDAAYLGARATGTVALDLTSMQVVLPLEAAFGLRPDGHDPEAADPVGRATPGLPVTAFLVLAAALLWALRARTS